MGALWKIGHHYRHVVVLYESDAQRRLKTTASQARRLVHSTFHRPSDDLPGLCHGYVPAAGTHTCMNEEPARR